jgi:hypothetical protein
MGFNPRLEHPHAYGEKELEKVQDGLWVELVDTLVAPGLPLLNGLLNPSLTYCRNGEGFPSSNVTIYNCNLCA